MMISFLYYLTGNIYISVLLGITVYLCLLCDIVRVIKTPKNQLNFVISTLVAVGTAIGGALGFAVGSVAMAVTIGTTVAVGSIALYGGIALLSTALTSSLAKKDYSAGSATYGNPTLQTQTNPDLPVPLLYGTVKLAGNRINSWV